MPGLDGQKVVLPWLLHSLVDNWNESSAKTGENMTEMSVLLLHAGLLILTEIEIGEDLGKKSNFFLSAVRPTAK